MVKLVEIEVEPGHSLWITEEQARWLAHELRTQPPDGRKRAARKAALMLEHAIEGERAKPHAKTKRDGWLAILAILSSDRMDAAPEPCLRMRDLRNALATFLGRD